MASSGKCIDLNADVGEYATDAERRREFAILRFVSSCNIACGGHTGDLYTMEETLRAALSGGVSCGAHPSYPDREGFGRRQMDISAADLKSSLEEQLRALRDVAARLDASLSHVKVHGRLYNDAMVDNNLAIVVADAQQKVLPGTALVGLPDSAMSDVAKKRGIPFFGEGFIDRRYLADGRLMSRTEAGAVIEDQADRLAQARALAEGKAVNAAGGNLCLNVDTLCLHADSADAELTAQSVQNVLVEVGIDIRPVSV